MQKYPKVGLALGAGLSRGLAHIGVIKILEEENVPIDYLAGTSMGSIIGAMYAGGMKLPMIERLSRRIQRRNWLDFNFPKMGLMSGEKLEEFIFLLTRQRKIEELPIPFAAVAVDLNEGQRVVLKKGSVARAVRASCAIPGIFNPVESGERLLVDGGVLERVPVEVISNMGAEVTIAVDVTYHAADYPINNVFDVISKTIDLMSGEITRYRTDSCDVLVTPYMRDLAPSDFSRTEEAIQRGEEATRKIIPRLLTIIKERSEERCSEEST